MKTDPANMSPAPQNEGTFEAAQYAGNKLAWAGFLLAIVWWASAGGLFYSFYAGNLLGTLSPGLLIAIGGVLFMPGLILLFAGFLARQNKRTYEANLLLLKASGQLLSPARTAIDDITNLAEATRYSTAAINQSSAKAIAAMKEVSEAMASERLRAESVGYAMADNARDLTHRLSEERKALEALSHTLGEQATLMGDAIPRQVQFMNQAAKDATSSIDAFDLNLEKRIAQIKQASGNLAERLIDLDAASRDAAARTENLNTSIAHIEQTLEQSQRNVKMAERASTMASDAAKHTGKSLQDAVSAALDGAREASREIETKTRLIQEAANTAMAQLKKTGAEAAQTAARVQEQSLAIAEDVRPEQPMRITEQPIIAQAPDAPPAQDETARPPFRKRPMITEVSIKPDEKRASDARRIYLEEIDPIAETRPIVDETDLFDAPKIGFGPPDETHETRAPRPQTGPIKENIDAPQPPAGPDEEDAFELGHASAPQILNHGQKAASPAPNGRAPTGRSEAWRDIIADIGEDATDMNFAVNPQNEDAPISRREATAEELISRLQNSGIPLPTAFRSRDKKKIAAAARKDQDARRKAIRTVAGNEVDRVAMRLNKDDQLMDMARRFVSSEQTQALKALEDTGNSGRHASARLSAYLLLDTALSPTLGT